MQVTARTVTHEECVSYKELLLLHLDQMIDADHFSISKPKDEKDEIFIQVTHEIESKMNRRLFRITCYSDNSPNEAFSQKVFIGQYLFLIPIFWNFDDISFLKMYFLHLFLEFQFK